MELFASATRLKLRFDTKQGQLCAEDLWDLPLTSTRTNYANLDAIAIDLDKQIRDTGTTSFVKKATRTNEILKIKFDIVLFVISVLQTEAEAAETIRLNTEKKQQILSIIANKENEALANKSLDELRELVSSL